MRPRLTGKEKTAAWLMFLIGTFSHTQIYFFGAMGISELVVFVIAPFLFCMDYATLRRDGFLPILMLILLSFASCIVSCLYNDVYLKNAIRGYMGNYSLFAGIVVVHNLLRKNLDSFKWFLLGVAISCVINTFAFRSAVEVAMESGGVVDGSTTSSIMDGALYWTSRLGGFWVLPYQGWYIATPMYWNVAAPSIWAIVFAIFSGGSGRSAALTMFGSSFIIFLCGKSLNKIQKVSKRLPLVMVGAIIGVMLLSVVYRYTAANGMLGEKAQQKFESQVKDAKSPLAILMAGRAEFFAGLFACCRQPLTGYGPWPIDKEHIYEDWLVKYGNAEDVDKYFKRKQDWTRAGYSERYHLIPAHSVIIQFWLWFGIGGLILWIYVLTKIWRYIRYDMSAIPQYIGYVAGGVPVYLWSIFFSPFGGRMEYSVFLSMILFAAQVKKGRLKLTARMQYDIWKANNG